jgi:hypothetical protein
MSENVNLNAPVGSVDVRALDDDGNAYKIRARSDCLLRHAEVVVDEESGSIMVREWHAIGCPMFQELINGNWRISVRAASAGRPQIRSSRLIRIRHRPSSLRSRSGAGNTDIGQIPLPRRLPGDTHRRADHAVGGIVDT